MGTSTVYRMADRLAEGKLAEVIANFVAEGLSLDAIASRLYANYGIEVTRQTVANWCRQEGIDRATTEAAS